MEAERRMTRTIRMTMEQMLSGMPPEKFLKKDE
uniref:Uncharacterized protein n=1 Tax=Variovorax paradoxus (strain S110) TaxID=543728 RepID=C5CJP1_VARPS